MFSKACVYGIRASIFVASESRQNKKASIKEIAIETSSPEPFVANTLQTLVKEGVISSKKGPNGGFYLTSTQLQSKTMMDVVHAIDGEDVFKSCVLGLERCSEQNPCPIHDIYAETKEKMTKKLVGCTLNSCVDKYWDGEHFLKSAEE